MMLHIVLASDGSPASQAAAQWITRHFTPNEIRLTVLTVSSTTVPDWGPANFGPVPMTADALETQHWAKAQTDADALIHLVAAFHPQKVVIQADAVVPAIIRGAVQHQADVIVVGRHNRPDWHAWFLGSVARGLAEASPLPVWIIPPKTR
ncbi:hypothetical protein TPY_0921 [Sulfobacillus acidophilus TPY]|nr:hypothetical protein TPY_0921 [Sulfobacillus acidophilus TPY]